MIVCHCRGVTDCAIRLAIDAGARDVDTLAMWAGAGARCSGCRTALHGLLQEMTGAATWSEGVSTNPAAPHRMNTLTAPGALAVCHSGRVASGASCDRYCGGQPLGGEGTQASRQVG